MNSFIDVVLANIHTLGMQIESAILVAVFTGLILVPVIVIGYELQGKRRIG